MEEIDREFKVKYHLAHTSNDATVSVLKQGVSDKMVVRGLDEIDLEFRIKYALSDWDEKIDTKRHAKWRYTFPKKVCGLAICALLIFVLSVGILNGGMGGYSWFRLLNGSMQREIPAGSLVITRKVEPANIQVGHNITFSESDGRNVTHKVIEVIHTDGDVSFRTKGTENAEPDPQFVSRGNLVGKVVWHVSELGNVLSKAGGVLLVMAVVLVVIAVVVFFKSISKNKIKQNYMMVRVGV